MKWTKEQQRAIDERGRNILVAAAAGSGKTAVLVERIKKLIIEDGVSLDRMLIVTFTNAAAAEMKEKIRRALYQEIEEYPQHGTKMREQLALLPRANISTFHAFALEVIGRFFYEADIEPGFSICDDAQRTILKEDAMDLLMEQWFAKDDEAFYDFLGWYSGDRNQDRIREMIDNVYHTLMAMPHPWQWLDDHVDALSVTWEDFPKSKTMEYIWQMITRAFKESVDLEEQAAALLWDQGLERLAEKVTKEELAGYHRLSQLTEEKDWKSLDEAIKSMKTLRLVANKEEKQDYEEVKDVVASCRKGASQRVSDVKKMFFTFPLEEQVGEMNQTASKAKLLRQLLLDFDHIFRLAKEEKHVIDFQDIEHFCLEILEEGEAARYYRDKFQHIFIDEYQDTNILQEEIISLIKRDNNLFMVGDIKQSIYKFRLAEPEIFKNKYTSYQQEKDSVKIDLNQNFRSKPAILKEINGVFEDLMEDYDEDARLYPGINYDGPYQYVPELKVVDAATVDESDEELASMKNTELEALETARLIRENLGRKFYDHKRGVERPLRLRDMVILMRGTRNYADIFYQTLKDQGISAYVDESDGYFDTIEISVFMNLLSVIDNKQQDIPLISVLRSEIFKFSSVELAQIRAEHKTGAFADAVMFYGEEGSQPSLRDKCSRSLLDLKRWKAKALSLPLGDFIWSLMLETGYYLEMGSMPGGRQRQANLRALVDKAEQYMENRQVSLYSFVRYIDAVKTRKVPMGQVKLIGEQDELVRIMTIHKSKGLEFPMVIVSGMGRRLNYTKMRSGAVIHKDIGIGMTLADFEGHWYKQTLLQKLISLQVHQEELAEEVRILYVALTRAKDFLYMTGTVREGQKYLTSLETGVAGESTYLDMIGATTCWQLVDAGTLGPVTSTENKTKKNPLDDSTFGKLTSEERASEVLRRLNYRYPYEKARQMKSKYSVTEINRMAQSSPWDSVQTLTVPNFRQGEKVYSAAEKGNIYHGLMERLDFDRAVREGLSYVKTAAADMVKAEIFTEEEIQAVNLERIEKFFCEELGKRAAKAFAAGNLQRERPFDLQIVLEEEPVIVQGIIDCYFEEEDGIVLVDYKTNRIDQSKPFEEEANRLGRSYEKQMEIYRRALTVATGKPVKETYLYLFDAGMTVRME